MLADELDYVVGVDTHRDEHALAIVDARTGALIAQATTAARGRGYAEAVRFADRHVPLLEGMFLVFSAAVIVMNLIADLMYPIIDPRVRAA